MDKIGKNKAGYWSEYKLMNLVGEPGQKIKYPDSELIYKEGKTFDN
jgi:hypothetical protein